MVAQSSQPPKLTVVIPKQPYSRSRDLYSPIPKSKIMKHPLQSVYYVDSTEGITDALMYRVAIQTASPKTSNSSLNSEFSVEVAKQSLKSEMGFTSPIAMPRDSESITLTRPPTPTSLWGRGPAGKLEEELKDKRKYALLSSELKWYTTYGRSKMEDHNDCAGPDVPVAFAYGSPPEYSSYMVPLEHLSNDELKKVTLLEPEHHLDRYGQFDDIQKEDTLSMIAIPGSPKSIHSETDSNGSSLSRFWEEVLPADPYKEMGTPSSKSKSPPESTLINTPPNGRTFCPDIFPMKPENEEERKLLIAHLKQSNKEVKLSPKESGLAVLRKFKRYTQARMKTREEPEKELVQTWLGLTQRTRTPAEDVIENWRNRDVKMRERQRLNRTEAEVTILPRRYASV